MRLTEKDVRYVAGLANLNLTDEEVGRMLSDLDGILGQMDKLAAIDTEGVEPMAQVLSGASDDPAATLREDVERTLRLLGCSSVAELDKSYVSVPQPRMSRC